MQATSSTFSDFPRVAILAGEPSGDSLGADLMRALKQIYPQAEFEGIGGPKMVSEGCTSLFPMEKLSVFGLFEVLKHLPELLRIRRRLLARWLAAPPDVFIGIDAPDFNLHLENKLHQRGVKTIHYVSPTVWAWRPGRIKKLIGTLDALLCIFPFEATYFQDTPVPAHYIGHPLADTLTPDEGGQHLRRQLNVEPGRPLLTLMPGSRMGELKFHAELFLETAARCAAELPDLKILVPLVNQRTHVHFQEILENSDVEIDISLLQGNARDAIQAADCVLVASGTATLEVMLLQRPMLAVYCLSGLTHWVFKTFKLLKVPFVSMPNLIANQSIVREFLQDAAKPELLTAEILKLLQDHAYRQSMLDQFNQLQPQLAIGASKNAAQVVRQVLES